MRRESGVAPLTASLLTRQARRVVVLACGDPLRGDDSIAPLAVAGMDDAALAGAEVRIIGALEPEHLVDLPAGTAVVIVDAVVGVEPGRLVELELDELAGHARRVVTTSSHQLPLDRVVALAQLLRDAPLAGRFVGVGIADVRPGEDLSAPTEAAPPALRAAVESAIASLAGP
jgi:hydrogenase maturation protease